MRGPYEPLRLVVEACLTRGGRQRFDERAGEAGERRQAVCEEVGRIRVIAAEELVPALAGERNLDVLGRELRNEVGRERGRVGEGLVERLGKSPQQQLGLRPDEQLVVLRSVSLSDEPRVVALVERALLEADRERVHRLRRLLGGE